MALHFSYSCSPRFQTGVGRTSRRRRGRSTLPALLRNHRILVEGMRSLGFQTLLDDAIQSPIITSFLYPHKDFDFKAFYLALKSKGFVIYPGKISKADTFRIGNIGDVYPEDFRRLVEVIRETEY